MFQILKVDESGYHHHVEIHCTPEAAEARVKELHQYWPARYLIRDQSTGESIHIKMNNEAEPDAPLSGHRPHGWEY